MPKISFPEWVDSMSFFLDDEFDTSFIQSVSKLAQFMSESRTMFCNVPTLEDFLTTNGSGFDPVLRLSAFIAIIGLSEERLKRVVTLARFKFLKQKVSTEWDVERICKEFLRNGTFRGLLLNFFVNGRGSELGAYYPIYYLKNFRLLKEDCNDHLASIPYVERILEDSEVLGMYSNAIGDHVEKTIEIKLLDYKRDINPNLQFERQKEFLLLNKNIDFIIPSRTNAQILIESSYNITTGSGQSKRADQLIEMYGILSRHNANHQNNKIILISFCDGLGWVGRQNDLRKIYVSCDYVLNHANLHQLGQILTDHFN